jgi:hypothetical protein
MIVITTTGPKAQVLAHLTCLSALSTTYRLERRLCINKSTQSFNHPQCGHHTLTCNKEALCRSCALRPSTRDHTCPIATCPRRGHLCAPSSPACVNCSVPNDAPSPTCSTCKTLKAHVVDEVVDEVQMVGTEEEGSLRGIFLLFFLFSIWFALMG